MLHGCGAGRADNPSRNGFGAGWSLVRFILSADYADFGGLDNTNCRRSNFYQANERVSAARPSLWSNRKRKFAREIDYLFAYVLERSGIAAFFERFGDEIGDFQHFFFFHAACGDRGRADANAAGFER